MHSMLRYLGRHYVHDHRVFAARQADHCLAARAKMRAAQDAVVTSMREIYANFSDGSAEVRVTLHYT